MPIANTMDFSEHLHNRGLRPWHHLLGLDHASETVHFPLYGPNFRLVGYQRYFWRGTKKSNSNQLGNAAKYFTWITPAYRPYGVYGLDNCFGYGPLFITEGIWDAISIGNCWRDCIAVLSATPARELREWIQLLFGNRLIIAICDRDGTGGKLARIAHRALTIPAPWKDSNEMPEDELTKWLERATI